MIDPPARFRLAALSVLLALAPALAAQSITVTTTVLSDYNGQDITCTDNCDGIAIANASGGIPPYSYLWSDGQTNAVAIGLCAGTHTVEVRDLLGLVVATATVDIVPPPPLTVTAVPFAFAGGFNISCHGEDDGQASASASGGTGAYGFLWGDGQTGPNAVDLSAGSLFVQVTDANFCTALDTVTLVQPDPLQAGASIVLDVSCRGRADGSVTVVMGGGSGGFSYAWGDGPSGPVRDGLEPGSYTVSVTDVVGCPFDTTFTIGNRPVLQARLDAVTPASCAGLPDGGATLDVAGGTPPYAYRWTDGSADPALAGAPPGEYVAAVTDARGCTATVPVTVDAANQLRISGLAVGPACGAADGAVHLSTAGADGPVSYLWSDGQTTASATGLEAGAYDVIVSDAACTRTDTWLVPSASDLDLDVSATPSDCGLATGTATASPLGGEAPYAWLWSNGETTPTATGLPAGRHWVRATDANGCSALAWVRVPSAAEALSLTAAVTAPSACARYDGGISASAGGGTAPYTWAWNNGATGPLLDGLGAGLYEAVVTDLAGCRDTLRVAVQDVALAVTTTDGAADCGTANAEASIAVIGGTPPYRYRWSSGDTTAAVTGRAPGAHTVVIRDDAGCTGYVALVLEASPGVDAFADARGISCAALDDGRIDLSVRDGRPAYAFAWADGPTTEDRAGLTPDTYTVAVLDAAGCQASGPVPLGDGCDQPLDAVDDLAGPTETEPLVIVVLANDSYPARPDVFAALAGEPARGTAVMNADFSVTYTAPEGALGADSVPYRLCNGFGACDTATIYLDVQAQFALPDAFSPNGDGINETFTIRGIDAFPGNRLVVFNRWGDEVFRRDGYTGDWAGTAPDGRPLPDGTYYFTLDLGDGSAVRSGPLEIHR